MSWRRLGAIELMVLLEAGQDPHAYQDLGRASQAHIIFVNGFELELYTETLGEKGSGAESYIGMMRTNVERIAEGLRK